MRKITQVVLLLSLLFLAKSAVYTLGPGQSGNLQAGGVTYPGIHNAEYEALRRKLVQENQNLGNKEREAVKANQVFQKRINDQYRLKVPSTSTLVSHHLEDESGVNEAPTEDRPTGGQPEGDQSSGEQPTGDQPLREQPEGEQPEGDQPLREQPEGEQPEGDQPLREQPEGDVKLQSSQNTYYEQPASTLTDSTSNTDSSTETQPTPRTEKDRNFVSSSTTTVTTTTTSTSQSGTSKEKRNLKSLSSLREEEEDCDKLRSTIDSSSNIPDDCMNVPSCKEGLASCQADIEKCVRFSGQATSEASTRMARLGCKRAKK